MRMHLSTTVRRLTAIVLLLCIPLQATAALLLPCAMEKPATVSCHLGNGDSDVDSDQSMLQCHTCALSLSLLTSITVTPGITGELTGTQLTTTSGPIHYYQFVPLLLHRPPVAT